MAVVTWTGSVSTTYSTDGNWDTGSVPGDGDDVVIPDTSSINACNVDSNDSCNSLTVSSNGEIGSDNGSKLAILGEADGTGATTNGFAVNIDGVITNNGGTSLDLDIRTPAATTVDLYAQGGGKLRNVIINHASCVATLGALIDITGDLTITAGELNTNSGSNYAVTVAGRTDIGPGSGGADQATLTCNASTVSLGSGRTSSHALIINQGGTFVGGSGAHTIGSIDVKNNSNAKCTLTSGNTTVNSEKTGDDRNMVIAGSSTFAHGGGTIIVTFAGTTHYDIDKTINNLTLNNASLVQKLSDSSVLAGNLTITAGQFNANGRNLTVAGDVDVTGTLTGSSGAMSFGSLTIASGGTYSATSGTTTITNEVSGAFALDKHASGTFNHNSGTVEVTTNTNTFIDGFEGTVTSGSGANALNNLIVNLSDSASYHFRLRPNSGTAHTILGNLTVTQGMFELETDSHTLTVNGDVSVGANGTLGRLAKTGNDSFGSLTIASGGTYNATSGTTTITGEVAATDYSWKNDGGTFTHNNGKVLLTEDSDCKVKENTFYDFELNLNSATTDCVFEDTSGNTLTFLGDLTLTRGRFDDDANGDEYIIHGNTIIESNAKFGKATNWHTGDITHHGLVVLNGGTYYRSDAGGTVKMGGIRNIGGSIL